MKKYILIAVVGLMGLASAAFTNAQAQKYAYVNTEYILSNIPEFTQAQEQIDKLSIEWQKELEEKFAEIDALYKKFQHAAPL